MSKGHPCFVKSSDECLCGFVPRQGPSGSNVSKDFVPKPDGKLKFYGKSPPKVTAKNPVFTERRQKYEDLYPIHKKEKIVSGPTDNKHDEVPVRPPLDIPDIHLLRIKSYREENMRECMSTLNRLLYRPHDQETSDHHRCRHRFRINDQNHLEAINVDELGRSACEECGEKIENLTTGPPWCSRRSRRGGDLSTGDKKRVPIILLEDAVEPVRDHHVKTSVTAKKGHQRKSSVHDNRSHKRPEFAFSSALIHQELL